VQTTPTDKSAISSNLGAVNFVLEMVRYLEDSMILLLWDSSMLSSLELREEVRLKSCSEIRVMIFDLPH